MAEKQTVGELVYKIRGDMEDLKKDVGESKERMGELESQMKNTKSTTGGLTGGFSKMKAAVAAASVAVGHQLVRGLNFAVNAAADLNESMNAVNVMFGDSADKIREFGRTAATEVGLAQAEFNQMAANTAAMVQNSGEDMDIVADKTVKLTKRAADLASVYNTDVDQAMGAIQSALRGQSEPLTKYGANILAANVKQKALEEGIIDTKRQLTQQEKALARYQLIMEETNDVQGDFRRTSDSFANSTRILKAQITDLSAQFGAALLPALGNLVGEASEAIAGVGGTTEAVNNMAKTFFRASEGIILAVRGIKRAVNGLTAASAGVTEFVSKGVAGWLQQVNELDAVNSKKLDSVTQDLTNFAVEAGEQTDQAVDAMAGNNEKLREAWNGLINAEGFKEGTQEEISQAVSNVQDALNGTSESAEKAGDKAEDFSKDLLKVRDSAEKATNKLKEDLQTTMDQFGEDIRGNVQDTVSKLATTFVDAEDKAEELKKKIRELRGEGEQTTNILSPRGENQVLGDFQFRDAEEGSREAKLQEQLRKEQKILEQREGFEERQSERIDAVKTKLEDAGISAEEVGIDNLMEEQSLEEEIAEQRRLNDLNEFQRFEQQQAKKLATLTDNFVAEVSMMKEKIEKRKNFQSDLTSFLNNEQKKRLENTQDWAEETMAKYGEVANKLRGVLTTERRLGNLQTPTPNSPEAAAESTATSTQQTTNNTTNVEAPVTINGESVQNLDQETLSSILGFELSKRVDS